MLGLLWAYLFTGGGVLLGPGEGEEWRVIVLGDRALLGLPTGRRLRACGVAVGAVSRVRPSRVSHGCLRSFRYGGGPPWLSADPAESQDQRQRTHASTDDLRPGVWPGRVGARGSGVSPWVGLSARQAVGRGRSGDSWRERKLW